MDIRFLLERLEKVQKVPGGWQARCPAHQDKDPSLSIAKADDGRILIHCHAECPPLDVLAAIGLEFKDLFPEGRVSHWVPGAGLKRRREAHNQAQSDEILLAVAAGNRKKGVKLSARDLKLEREAFVRQMQRKQDES